MFGIDKKSLLIRRHDSDWGEFLNPVRSIFHHRHQVTTVEGKQNIVRVLLHVGNLVATDFSSAIGLVADEGRLGKQSIRYCSIAERTGIDIRSPTWL